VTSLTVIRFPGDGFLLNSFQEAIMNWKILFVILLNGVVALAAQGAILRGSVTDYSNGKPLAGVTITLKELSVSVQTGDDGRFRIEGIPAGRYVVQAAKSGYSSIIREVVLSENDVFNWEIELRPSSKEELSEQPRYLLPEVTVATTRAQRETPVSYSNLDRKDVDTRYNVQDIPVLLTEMPGINAYSDNGNAIGYSYLKLRGFTQNRVAVMLNNTPLNDAESHEVFWIDLPDFPSDVQDIQVQRGVGSSLYGAAALGGSINLVTKLPGVGEERGIKVSSTYGSFNTRKASIALNSGRIAGRYGLAGRITGIHSDGYRFGSWTNLWSYYFSAARISSRHTTHLNFYGGPEETHLAYEGIPKDAIQGQITGDKEHDRRLNPLTYKNEIDHFFQPHFELHDEWKLADKLELFNTFYIFKGDGYYDQYRPGKNLAEYFYQSDQSTVQVGSDTLFESSYYVDENDDGLPDPDTLDNGQVVYHVKRFDLLRRRNINEIDGGWIPRAVWDYGKGELVLGGELRLHHAHHEGILRSGNPLPTGISSGHHYYDYQVRKQSIAVYMHVFHKLTESLRAMMDLQIQSQEYNMGDDKLFGVEVDKSYSAFTPRLGLNYLLLKPEGKGGGPVASVYMNFSMAQREPAFSDIYDPQDYWSLPISVPNRFESRAGGYKYIGESLKPEKLTNFEVGTAWEWKRFGLGANAYSMSLRDEIIPYGGQLDDNGVPISGNAEKTLHQGVEFVTACRPIETLTISGNLALTDDQFVHYKEWDWNAWDFVSRDGNHLAADPSLLGNLRVEWRPKQFLLALSLRAIGKQYVDNSQTDSTAVPAYEVVNLDVGHRFRKVVGLQGIELRLRVNNLLNREYETSGYIDSDDGLPRYFVAPPINYLLTLSLDI
jgi:iron complex outermembrane receptor protein